MDTPEAAGSPLILGVCASPYWPPFTDAIVEVSRVGYATSLWQCVHGYDPEMPLRQWKEEGRRFDCILGILRTEQALALAKELAPRVISLASNLPPTTDTWNIIFDARKVGWLAADYFSGVKVAAGAFFCAEPEHLGLMERGKAFEEAILKAGRPFLGTFRDASQISEALLRAQDGPVGFFAADDQSASRLSSGLARRGVPVPYKAMILGVNDQDYLCHFGPVPLSSIRLDGEGMGRACVDVLKGLAAGVSHQQPRTILIPPTGVTVRAITAISLVGDDLAGRAMAKLRQAATVPTDVNEWADMVLSSRRPLERVLRKVLNRTPKQILDGERVRRASHLLRTSHHSMDRVAELAGFSSARHLRETLVRLEGRTPSEVRGEE